jgi:hypothetical protein
VDSSLTRAPANVRALNTPVGGAGMGWRAREALERGGTSPEGATGPRARRGLTRGGVLPSSEADPHPRGHPTLERGGSLLVRCRARSSARGWLGRLSGGPPGPPGSWAGRWTVSYLKRVLGSFVFCFFKRKWVLTGCLGDPYC